jgi:uncharacterized protein
MKRLLVAIHDVTPAHESRLDRINALVENIIGPGKAALFAVPDFHRQSKIDSNPAFSAKLRRWADAGSEIFLHGYFHLDSAQHRGRSQSWKAKHLTAGEGEFLGLEYAEATRLLVDGRKQIEDVIGGAVAGFVAPAWLYGPGAKQAMAELGFPLAEDHFKVWEPKTGNILTRGPVITYAIRTPTRLLSSLVWSRVAGVLLKPAPVVRVGVHPHDCDAPELVGEITKTIKHFARSHVPSRYSDLGGNLSYTP